MANGRGIRPKVCKRCSALADDGALISFRGLCQTCSNRAVAASITDLSTKSGDYWERWRASMADAMVREGVVAPPAEVTRARRRSTTTTGQPRERVKTTAKRAS